VAIAVALVVWARLWGQHVHWHQSGTEALLGAAPLFGKWDLEWRWWMVAAVAVGATGTVLAPRLWRSLPWPSALVVTWAMAAAWAVALASSEGMSRLAEPLVGGLEYYAVLEEIDGVGAFLAGYVEDLADYPTHVRGHPPGMVLAYLGLERIGLAGPGWAAAAVLTAGTSTVVAVMLTLREVAGAAVARAAAPFLALAPVAIWVASSADAVFAATAAWGTALVVVASGRPRSGWWALAGGGVLGLGLHMSYGLVLALVVPAAVVVTRRRADVVLWACVGAAAVTLLFALGGFWWFDGLSATRGFYAEGVARDRPYLYSVVGNLGAMVLVIGPGAVAGLGALAARRRELGGLALLVAAGVLAVVAADLSGLSKAEVERIWIPFAPWLIAAGAACPTRWQRPALAASVATALVMQTWLRSPW